MNDSRTLVIPYDYYYGHGLNAQSLESAPGRTSLTEAATRLTSLMYIPSMEEGFANFTDETKNGKALKAGMQNQVWEYPIE